MRLREGGGGGAVVISVFVFVFSFGGCGHRETFSTRHTLELVHADSHGPVLPPLPLVVDPWREDVDVSGRYTASVVGPQGIKPNKKRKGERERRVSTITSMAHTSCTATEQDSSSAHPPAHDTFGLLQLQYSVVCFVADGVL